MNKLSEIILNQIKDSNKLVKEVNDSPYLKCYDYHTESKEALDYINVIKNFYTFVDKDKEIERETLKAVKSSFIQPFIEDLGGLEEALKSCGELDKAEKKVIRRNLVFSAFSSLGLFFNPVFAVPTIVSACACIYPGHKILQVNKYRKDFVKRIQKNKESIEYWDSIELNDIKQVFLDNKEEIKTYL